jgi:hypothetical protein
VPACRRKEEGKKSVTVFHRLSVGEGIKKRNKRGGKGKEREKYCSSFAEPPAALDS